MTTAFGESMTDYVINLCDGRLDYMERLPDPVLLQIFMRADLQDVGRLSQLNKRFHRVSIVYIGLVTIFPSKIASNPIGLF